MHPHNKRSIACVLAVLSIVTALFLWAGIVRSLVASVAMEVPVETALQPESAPSSVSPAIATDTAASPSPPPVRAAPLMPPLHFAGSARGSAASRAQDQAQRDELLQWEIREFAALSIPSLSVRSTVFLPSRRYWDARDWETLERQMQVGLLYGVVSYPHAVAPGSNGTIVIAGHSSPPSERAKESRFGSVFAGLPAIEPHAEIILRTAGGTVTYAVVETKIVPAGNTAILAEQEKESLLKLITCYPVGSTKDRFLVIAKKVD